MNKLTTRHAVLPAWRDTVGRTSERQAALSALRAGRGLLVTGVAGIGKSRFVDALARELTGTGWQVVHVRATASSRQVPLGVFAGMLPDAPAQAQQPVELLHEMLMVLARRADAAQLAVVVDDVHQLDEQSVTLLQHVATSRVGPVVLAFRSGEDLPGGIEALVRDGAVDELVLRPLVVDQASTLVTRMSGAHLSSLAVADICRAAEGVPLFLVTLTRDHLESGGDRPPLPSPGLAAAVVGRLGRLDDEDRRALEAVALTEPLELALAERVADPAVLVRLERRGLLRVDENERRLTVRLGHPLYAEVLLAELPVIRRRALLREVAAHRGDFAPARRRHDLLRSVLWRLDGGEEVDVEALVGAAGVAASLGGAGIAERLARLAWERSPGDETAGLYIAVLLGVGRAADVDAFCARMPLPAGVERRTHLGVTWAIAVYAGLGEADRALSIVDRFRGLVPVPWRHELDAVEVMIRFYTGRITAAAAVVDAMFGAPDLQRRARVWALFPGVLSLAAAGRTAEAMQLGTEAVAEAPAFSSDIALASTQAYCVWGYASMLHGAERAVVLAMEERIPSARARMDPITTDIFSVVLGMALQQQGRLRPAADAYGQLNPAPNMFSVNWLPFSRAWRAECLARLGLPDEATALLIFDPVGGPDAMHRAAAVVAAAEVDVARGEPVVAAVRLDAAVERAESLGQLAVAMPAAFRALSLQPTDARAEVALALARRHDGLRAEGVAEAAAAWLVRDLDGAIAAAAGAEAAGLGLLALDCWELALWLAHGVAAAPADEARVRRHLDGHRERLGVPAPADLGGLMPVTLTDRERAVAERAAAGWADKDIAADLAVSVRTVHAHLRAVYQKLGIGGRRALRGHPLLVGRST